MATMRAAFFEAARTLTVREAPIPEPQPGDVRLRVRCTGICGSDLSLYTTGALAGPDVILGHEISAVVDLDPSGAWERGARVVPYPAGRGCGECVWCLEGRDRYCLNPSAPHGGGNADFLIAPSGSLVPVPDDVDDRSAALAEPLGVALRAIERSGAAPGDLAYVSGLGSIGLLAASGLAALGCRVIGADPREDRRSLGLELGCEAVFDPTSEDPFATTLSLDSHGPRVAFECAGAPESLQQVIDACGFGGTVAILGVPMAPAFLLRMLLKELSAFSIRGPSKATMARALEHVRSRPQVSKIIGGTVPLEEAGAAFERLLTGDGGVKILVEPDGGP